MIKFKEKGQILLLVFVALGVVLFTVLFIIGGAQIYFQNATYSVNAEAALALAEAGADKAVASLNKTGGSYNGEAETILGEGSYSVTITTKDAATKVIEATGYIPTKAKPKVKRTIQVSTSSGVGVSFIYGVQVGDGGLELGNNNQVIGSIYSNGNITAGNNNTVTGDVWVASGAAPLPDQQTDCEGANCQDFIFGKTVNAETRLDIAQSFKPTMTSALNKVSLKIKKFGNPSDVTVRIMRDSGGKPDKNDILTTGTLFASLVTSSYNFIDVTFSSSPALSANTPYWIMVDTSADNNNYWSWQNDLAQSYIRGNPAYSPNWNTGNPLWNQFTADLSFKVFLGGTITSIRAGSNFTVTGNAHANTIEKLTIQKDAYFKTIIDSTVGGTSFPNSEDPPPKVFPISDANINDWKNQAQANGTIGPITNCVATLDSKKIVGDISLGNDCTIIVKSPIWITGKLDFGNNNTFKLDPSYGATSGVIVVDGKINLGNNNKFLGTPLGSSLLMTLTTFDSRTNNQDAIDVGNNGNTGVFYAHLGIIDPGNNNQFKELTAWKIRLTNNSTINYETGLSSTLFSSGPGGTYSLVKGTYQVK